MTLEAQRLAEELRDACMKIRVKASIPLSALIPIMQRAADAIDKLASMIPAGGLAEEAPAIREVGWHEPWRVGEFVSSSNRPAHVLMLAVGEKQISEYGAHRDFIRWMDEQASRRTYRASVLEEAAQACEDIADEYGDREGGKWPELKSDAQSGAKACENALRALAAKTQEGQEP